MRSLRLDELIDQHRPGIDPSERAMLQRRIRDLTYDFAQAAPPRLLANGAWVPATVRETGSAGEAHSFFLVTELVRNNAPFGRIVTIETSGEDYAAVLARMGSVRDPAELPSPLHRVLHRLLDAATGIILLLDPAAAEGGRPVYTAFLRVLEESVEGRAAHALAAAVDHHLSEAAAQAQPEVASIDDALARERAAGGDARARAGRAHRLRRPAAVLQRRAGGGTRTIEGMSALAMRWRPLLAELELLIGRIDPAFQARSAEKTPHPRPHRRQLPALLRGRARPAAAGGLLHRGGAPAHRAGGRAQPRHRRGDRPHPQERGIREPLHEAFLARWRDRDPGRRLARLRYLAAVVTKADRYPIVYPPSDYPSSSCRQPPPPRTAANLAEPSPAAACAATTPPPSATRCRAADATSRGRATASPRSTSSSRCSTCSPRGRRHDRGRAPRLHLVRRPAHRPSQPRFGGLGHVAGGARRRRLRRRTRLRGRALAGRLVPDRGGGQWPAAILAAAQPGAPAGDRLALRGIGRHPAAGPAAAAAAAEYDDPFLDRHLASELAGADAPDTVLPGPEGLVAACSGAAAVLARAVEAVAAGGWTAVTVPPEQFDAVVAGSGLGPGSASRLLDRHLGAAAARAFPRRLRTAPGARACRRVGAGRCRGLDRRAGAAQRLGRPPGHAARPLAGALASPGVRAALGSALEPEWPPLAADGSPAVEPDDHRSPALLAALAAAGATAQVRTALARWRPLALSVGMLDELQRVLADPAAQAVAGLCARLDDRLEPATVQIHTERMKKTP